MRNGTMTMAIVLALLLAGTAQARAPGERVLARWSGDALWYPARVLADAGGSVQVAFDDGDVEAVAAADVKAIDWRVGSRLQCNWQNKGTYYGGVVAAMQGETITFQYDDGDVEAMTISRCRASVANRDPE